MSFQIKKKEGQQCNWQIHSVVYNKKVHCSRIVKRTRSSITYIKKFTCMELNFHKMGKFDGRASINQMHIWNNIPNLQHLKTLFGLTFFTPQFLSNANDAKDWCETTKCPAPSAATQENCCIHHMNLHSCPLTDITNGLCGPWIPARGQIITHSEVLVGNALVGNWTNYVPGLYVLGQTSIISHFKIAGASIALVFDLTVEPKTGKLLFFVYVYIWNMFPGLFTL